MAIYSILVNVLMVFLQNRGGGLDMNVLPAWREGVTGQGVVVAILDDGLEMDHPDLLANYVSLFFIYIQSFVCVKTL